MWSLLALVGAGLFGIGKAVNDASWNKEHSGTLDVDAMDKDDVKVCLGELSKAEFKRRVKSGYYNR